VLSPNLCTGRLGTLADSIASDTDYMLMPSNIADVLEVLAATCFNLLAHELNIQASTSPYPMHTTLWQPLCKTAALSQWAATTALTMEHKQTEMALNATHSVSDNTQTVGR